MIQNIGIIGNGSWGTALAKILTDNGHKIDWWLRNAEDVAYLEKRSHNRHYLTSVSFAPGSLLPTNDLQRLFEKCDTVIVCIPSAYAQGVLSGVPASCWAGKNIISAIKGILPDCNMLLNDYLTQQYGMDLQQYVAITGPCHAEEVAQERISYLTFSGLNDALTGAAAAAFGNGYIHTKANHDIWGAQFAAVLKNIYAVGAGIAHGLDYGDNFLSVYITNCYREMYRFVNEHFCKVHPDAERPDFHTSAYLGDLLVTCYSMHSRNRTFGNMLGKGYTVKNAILEMKMVAEGYYAARGMLAVNQSLGLHLPITEAIHSILWEEAVAGDVFTKMEQYLS